MAKRAYFKWLTGDCSWTDYGGKWWRKVGHRRFHVMELFNWEDHCGRDAEGGPTYNVSLCEVDMLAATDDAIAQAMSFYGWDSDDLAEIQKGMRHPDLVLVEAFHSYGQKSPLWDCDGNNFTLLMRECRAQSLALDDPVAHEAAMSRPVNRLGSTAREFGQGDVFSALDRSVRTGNSEGKIVAMMYGVPSEVIEAHVGTEAPRTTRVNTNGSDDPLAYACGHMDAAAGRGLAEPREDLAPEYLRGYRETIAAKSL
jgi:hypothetical protein